MSRDADLKRPYWLNRGLGFGVSLVYSLLVILPRFPEVIWNSLSECVTIPDAKQLFRIILCS